MEVPRKLNEILLMLRSNIQQNNWRNNTAFLTKILCNEFGLYIKSSNFHYQRQINKKLLN